jgi:lipoate-protein ligase B
MNFFRPVWCVDLGLMEFKRAHALQLEILEARISGKIDQDVVLLQEHPPVFTIGRRGKRDHLKVSSRFLDDAGMDLVRIERGGDITYHGPGQLVVYPIFQLRQAGLGVVDLVERLEEVMIRTADDTGVSASRDQRNHGIWTGNRKIGFVGIAVRRGVSFHGISLNVDLSLEPFTWIDPCGMQNILVTSLSRETENTISLATAKTSLKHHLGDIFQLLLHDVKVDKLKDLIQSKQS